MPPVSTPPPPPLLQKEEDAKKHTHPSSRTPGRPRAGAPARRPCRAWTGRGAAGRAPSSAAAAADGAASARRSCCVPSHLSSSSSSMSHSSPAAPRRRRPSVQTTPSVARTPGTSGRAARGGGKPPFFWRGEGGREKPLGEGAMAWFGRDELVGADECCWTMKLSRSRKL